MTLFVCLGCRWQFLALRPSPIFSPTPCLSSATGRNLSILQFSTSPVSFEDLTFRPVAIGQRAAMTPPDTRVMDSVSVKAVGVGLGGQLREPVGRKFTSWLCPLLTVLTGTGCLTFASLSFLTYRMGPPHVELRCR